MILQLGLQKIHISSFSITDAPNTVGSARLYGPRGQPFALQPGPVIVLFLLWALEKKASICVTWYVSWSSIFWNILLLELEETYIAGTVLFTHNGKEEISLHSEDH